MVVGEGIFRHTIPSVANAGESAWTGFSHFPGGCQGIHDRYRIQQGKRVPCNHMYKSYYGFRKKPFQMTPDPAYLFMSRGHADTYAHLEYALMEDKGFIVITGEVGSGKTSLINLLIRECGGQFTVGVLNPNIARTRSGQFTEMICRQFDLDVTGVGTAEMPGIFRDFLIMQQGAGSRAILIVDEAQGLTDTMMEEVRLLANLRTGRHYLVQIILAGQPELEQKLRQNKVRQFVQRVTVCRHLGDLDKNEVGQYIRHHLQHAGGSKSLDIFDNEAIESIYVHSKGIPRRVNIISDAALVYGYADELQIIGKRVVEEVVKDRDTDGVPIGGARRGTASSVPVPPRTAGEERDNDTHRDVEKEIYALENAIYDINQRSNTRSSAEENQGEVGF